MFNLDGLKLQTNAFLIALLFMRGESECHALMQSVDKKVSTRLGTVLTVFYIPAYPYPP